MSAQPTTAKFRNYLEQFGPLPDRDWELLTACLQLRTFSRKHRILAAGQVENHVSWIDQGIIRFFAEDEEKDREITFEIGFEHSFATAYDSFLTRTPVRYEAEALTDTVLWSINYADLQELYRTTECGNRIGRLAAEQLYIRKNRRQMSLLKDSAEQRYLDMLNDYPHLIRHVPLKYLASWIGITPQALSRIRRRLSIS